MKVSACFGFEHSGRFGMSFGEHFLQFIKELMCPRKIHADNVYGFAFKSIKPRRRDLSNHRHVLLQIARMILCGVSQTQSLLHRILLKTRILSNCCRIFA